MKKLNLESGGVASVWFSSLVIMVVIAIVWGVFDPLLRGPLMQLVVQWAGDPVVLGSAVVDPQMIPNIVKGFLTVFMFTLWVIVILTPLRREGERYEV